MSFFSPAFSVSNDLEIELVDVGIRMTVDLNLGVINQGDEKSIEAKKAINETMIKGFLQ
jgi:hypothetical protein